MTAAATKLVFSDKVKFMVGGNPVPPFKAAIEPITRPNNVLRIDLPSQGTPQDLNADYVYTFTDHCDAVYQPTAYAHFLKLYPKVKTVALTCPDEPGGIGDKERMKTFAEANGLKVVSEGAYPFGTVDFYPILSKILAAKPDALANGSSIFPDWQGMILKQARELGFKGPVFSNGSGGDPYIVLKLAGKDYATDYVCLAPALKSPEMTPIIKEMVKIIRDKFGVEARVDHLFGWETLWFLAQAIEEAQSLDPTVVRDRWEKMKKIETLTGPGKMGGLKTYGVNHLVVPPWFFTRVMNGEVKHATWLTVEVP